MTQHKALQGHLVGLMVGPFLCSKFLELQPSQEDLPDNRVLTSIV